MEISYDWKSFQSFFISRKKITGRDLRFSHDAGEGLFTPAQAPVYLITHGNIIITAFSEGENLSNWSGSTFDELEARLGHREFIFFEQEKVDQWLSRSTECHHYYDQLLFLSQESQPQFVTQNQNRFGSVLQKHFLLNSLKSRWSFFFPVTYGVLICLDQNPAQSLFLQVQRGKVQSFLRPDFSGVIPERRKHSADLVRHLVEHYLIPVQGFFLTSHEWNEWTESSDPWRSISSLLIRDRTKLVPFRWGLVALAFLRARFKV